MVVLPPLKVCRYTPIILALSPLFNIDIKEGHIIKRKSWINHKVADFVIQAHHIPAVDVLVIVLIIFYIEGGIDKRVNLYGCCWDVGGTLVIIGVEFLIDRTGYAGNGGYTIVGALEYFSYELETINLFYFDWKIGVFVLRDTHIHFPTGSAMSVTITAVPQVGNCRFDTAEEVVVTVNSSISCLPTKINWMEVWAVGWHPEDLTAIILDWILPLAEKDFGLVEIHPNDGGNLEFFGWCSFDSVWFGFYLLQFFFVYINLKVPVVDGTILLFG